MGSSMTGGRVVRRLGIVVMDGGWGGYSPCMPHQRRLVVCPEAKAPATSSPTVWRGIEVLQPCQHKDCEEDSWKLVVQVVVSLNPGAKPVLLGNC